MRIHHFTILTSDATDPDRVLAVFAREGWVAEKIHNGPPHASFTLVRGFIENQITIEIGGKAMREEYERFFRDVVARATPPASAA